MIIHRFGLKALLIAALGVPAAIAGPTSLASYTINFAGSPLLPTSGAFTYDPGTPHFTDFSVIWDGTNFDLTAAANAPGISSTAPACIGTDTGAAATADLLFGLCNPSSGGTAVWEAILFGDGDTFFTIASDADQTDFPPQTPNPGIAIQAEGVGPVTGGQIALNPLGTFTATLTTTPSPEPASLLLMTTALFLVAYRARKRFAPGLRRTSRTNY